MVMSMPLLPSTVVGCPGVGHIHVAIEVPEGHSTSWTIPEWPWLLSGAMKSLGLELQLGAMFSAMAVPLSETVLISVAPVTLKGNAEI